MKNAILFIKAIFSAKATFEAAQASQAAGELRAAETGRRMLMLLLHRCAWVATAAVLAYLGTPEALQSAMIDAGLPATVVLAAGAFLEAVAKGVTNVAKRPSIEAKIRGVDATGAPGVQ